MVVWFNKATSAFLCLETKKSAKRKFKTNRSYLAQDHVHPGYSPTGPMRKGAYSSKKFGLILFLITDGFSRLTRALAQTM
jgi:hypothetical protein